MGLVRQLAHSCSDLQLLFATMRCCSFRLTFLRSTLLFHNVSNKLSTIIIFFPLLNFKIKSILSLDKEVRLCMNPNNKQSYPRNYATITVHFIERCTLSNWTTIKQTSGEYLCRKSQNIEHLHFLSRVC